MNETKPTFAGELAQVPLPKLLYRLAVAKQSGRLRLLHEGAEKEIFFNKGHVEAVHSNVPDETLVEYLSQNHGLDKEKLTILSETTGGKEDGQFHASLLASGLVDGGKYFDILVDHAQFRIANALFWLQGDYEFFGGNGGLQENEAPLKIEIFALLAEGVRTTIDDAKALVLLSQIEKAWLKIIEKPAITIDTLQMNAKELRIFNFLKEQDSVATAIKNLKLKHTDISKTELIKIIYFLNQMDIIALLAHAPPKSAKKSQPTKTATPKPQPTQDTEKKDTDKKDAGKEDSGSKKETDKEETTKKDSELAVKEGKITLSEEALKERADLISEQNHFEILGITDDADTAKVKKAYFQLARVLHPDTVRLKLGNDFVVIAEDYFAKVGQAYQLLSKDDERAEYLAGLKLKEEKPEIEEAKTLVEDVMHAEADFFSAKKAVERGNIKAAKNFLDRAMTKNPDEKEYQLYRAWITYNLAQKDTEEQRKQMVVVKNLVDGGLKNANAFYFLAMMYKFLDKNMDKAESLFKLTLKEDKRHDQATRELRVIEMRKKTQKAKKK